MKKLFMFLLVISTSLTLLVFSIEQTSYNKSYYMKNYEENNIEAVTGKNMEELDSITQGLISYLKGGENDLLRPHFNEKEILHMEDVQDLFNLARMIKYIGIIGIIISTYYFLKKKKLKLLAKTLFYGLFSNHIILAIIGFLAYTDFNKYFTYFHLIFFSNDLWILDPRTDLMIQMLPEVFFFTMAAKIMMYFLIYLSIIQLASFIYMKKGSLAIDRKKRSR